MLAEEEEDEDGSVDDIVDNDARERKNVNSARGGEFSFFALSICQFKMDGQVKRFFFFVSVECNHLSLFDQSNKQQTFYFTFTNLNSSSLMATACLPFSS